VAFDNGFTDWQAQTNASHTLNFPSEEFVENERLIVFRKTGPAVLNNDFHKTCTDMGRNPEGGTCRCVLHCVFQKIDEHLFEKHIVHPDQRQIRRNLR